MSEQNEKRGNISVPEVLLRKIKAQAAERGLTIREYVEPIFRALTEGKISPEKYAAR